MREKTLGSEHPDTLESISDLGRVLRVVGKCAEAEELHWRAPLLPPDFSQDLESNCECAITAISLSRRTLQAGLNGRPALFSHSNTC